MDEDIQHHIDESSISDDDKRIWLSLIDELDDNMRTTLHDIIINNPQDLVELNEHAHEFKQAIEDQDIDTIDQLLKS